MSVYSLDGISLQTAHALNGNSLNVVYDVDGVQIFDGSDSDYDEWSTEYQYTILQARDAWKAEYRSDNRIIPVIIHTDQHMNLNTHKSTFDYLSLAMKWQEISAIIGLGDVCGAVYNTNDLNNMVTCLSSLPVSKRIDIAGNHDCQLPKEEGSSYAYAPLTDELYHTLQNTYFNNSAYGGNNSNTRYGYKGMEYVIDPLHNIKFCVFAVWVTRGDPWYHYYCDSDSIEAMIDMLSEVDNYDIIILSHIAPYARSTTWYHPAVDGDAASTETKAYGINSLGYSVQLDQLYADRKAKRSGAIADCDGNVHTYDFTNCTSDLLCTLNGHHHADKYIYSPDGNVPAVLFDAYRYDNMPLHLVNIDRTRQRVNVWKFDEANNIYNYQVPFNELTSS